jgi:hypothetical protein
MTSLCLSTKLYALGFSGLFGVSEVSGFAGFSSSSSTSSTKKIICGMVQSMLCSQTVTFEMVLIPS